MELESSGIAFQRLSKASGRVKAGTPEYKANSLIKSAAVNTGNVTKEGTPEFDILFLENLKYLVHLEGQYLSRFEKDNKVVKWFSKHGI